MAKMKATPRTYAQAVEALAGRDSVKLGNNTLLEKRGYVQNDSVHIAVRLHSTDIVCFFPDGRVTLHSGGYRTMTTKERLNQFIVSTVYQKNYNWFVYRASDGSTVEFTEGMNVA
jgi:hypothetical protein